MAIRISLALIILFSSVTVFAQDAVTPEERIQIEYWLMKVNDANRRINDIQEELDTYRKGYLDAYSGIMKKYGKDQSRTNINLKTGQFIDKQPEKAETK